MGTRYEIHPTIGVGRLGDSTDSFYLAPGHRRAAARMRRAREPSKASAAECSRSSRSRMPRAVYAVRRRDSTCSPSTTPIRATRAAR